MLHVSREKYQSQKSTTCRCISDKFQIFKIRIFKYLRKKKQKFSNIFYITIHLLIEVKILKGNDDVSYIVSR